MKRGVIVLTPFPYTDLSGQKTRPALVVSRSDRPGSKEVMTMARDPIHPGVFLADEQAELHINATELAHALHVPPNRVYQILNGKRAMTADTALRLGQWLGTSAELWMNLQKMYESRLAEQQAGEEIRRIVKRWNPSMVASASAR